MFMRKLRKDKRGLTLIELVCALAILSIITATIGGAMVVATNSYRQGTVDTALQQEAQFTANSIESLIIDATDTVEWDASTSKLKIKNTDYTYDITYDSIAKTLTYSQYDTATGSPVTENQLLAEHVEKFTVDGWANFATTRNVRLTIGLKNQTSSFETTYNVTSRNDPNAGPAGEITAVVSAPENVVLEPLQEYVIPVSVFGPTDTSYTAYIVPESDGRTVDATVAPDSSGVGIKVTMGATETGGTDGLFRICIRTNVKKSDGSTPAGEAFVNVKVRRINDIVVSGFTLVSGDHLKEDAIYSLTATLDGTNLEQVVGADYEKNPYNYVDPNTLVWSFSVNGGESVSDWVEVQNPPGSYSSEVRFRLKQDFASSTKITAMATALHPAGVLSNGMWTNKASNISGSVSMYDNVYDTKELKKNNPFPDSNIRRGTENEIPANLDYPEMIREDWEKKKHPTETWDPMRGYNGGYKGRIWYRYKTVDGTDFNSPDYPKWHLMTNQGDEDDKLKLNAGDFTGMKYMKDYILEIYFSFEYIDHNNVSHVFPEDDDNNPNTNPTLDYIYEFEIKAMSIMFDAAQDTNGASIDLTPYLQYDKTGIGTYANPLILTYGGEAYIHYCDVTGASNQRTVFEQVITGAKIYNYNGSSWVSTGQSMGVVSKNDDHRSGMIKFHTSNGGLAKGKTYKIIFGQADGETYVDEPIDGQGGRGIIYFKCQ